MKPIIIIVLALGLVVASLAGYSIQNQDTGMHDAKPWLGLSCENMLDFSASDEHSLMEDSMHVEFHEHYISNCSDTEIP